MLKVLIADDEPKVCQLIYNLIDWNKYNMEVVAISNDGKTAFNNICEKQPDIVITDIRMPTYDGIELIRKAKEKFSNIYFIIISGHSQFEYAQKAVKYGVDDYLLKPLKKNELVKALEKIAEKHSILMSTASEKENLKIALDLSTEKVKKNLIYEMLVNPQSEKWNKQIEELNQEYCCNFRGNFITLIVRPYTQTSDYSNEMYSMLLSKLKLIVEKRLKECCSEVVSTIWNNEIVYFINTQDTAFSNIEINLQKSIHDANTLKTIFQNFFIVIGIGNTATTAKELLSSYDSAETAISNRVMYPRHPIVHSSQKYSEYETKSIFDADKRDAILSHLECLDFDGVINEISCIKSMIKTTSCTGTEVYECYQKIIEAIFFTIRNYLTDFSLPDLSFFLKKYQFMLTIDNIFDWLIEELKNEFDKYLFDKKYKESKPIILAKQYINQNYHTAISLESISTAIGFNPAYFSTLFKKETGKNFLEYVTEIRMRNAKSYLVKTDTSITDVAYKVGYADTKYFAKLFKKTTGLSPNNYRKLYS